eukprot:NODE_111_length_18624_cov_1.285020.p12 type:complete len:160 gc:universal NODE_111_length_18624_cov_1.285020:18232-17753(-)
MLFTRPLLKVSGYHIFLKEKMASMSSKDLSEVSSKLGSEWKSLSESAKNKYVEAAKKVEPKKKNKKSAYGAFVSTNAKKYPGETPLDLSNVRNAWKDLNLEEKSKYGKIKTGTKKLTPYNIWCKEHYSKYKVEGNPQETMKKLAKAWKKSPDSGKGKSE